MNDGEKANVPKASRRKGLHMLFFALKTALLLYAALVVLLFSLQARFIFPASHGSSRTPADVGWPFEKVTLSVGEDTTFGWFLPVANARATVLFSHGNGGNADLWLDGMAIYRRLGMNVLLYDYGGYGLSTGKPSEQRCYQDARAMWHWLNSEKRISREDIILVGRSLGAGVALQLATEVSARAVVLETPFLSIPAMARQSFPFVPSKLLVRHVFDNEHKVGEISAPVLIVHSEHDSIVPYSHGRRLYELAREPKSFLDVQGDHNDWSYTSEDAYEAGLEAFLRSYVDDKAAEKRMP